MTTQFIVSEFKKRTKPPVKADGVMWTCSGYSGGKSTAILGKPQAWKGSVLHNCVGYVFARIWECSGKKPVNIPTKAYLWITQGKYPKGTTPKLGAVGCFKKKGKLTGHIVYTENFVKDSKGNYTRVDITESGYNYYYWRYVKIYRNYCLITDHKGKTTKHYNYKLKANGQIMKADNQFQGYVYPIKVVSK